MPTDALNLPPGSPAEIARTLSSAFAVRHGRRPDGVYAAPGRVNLIGEHLDYNGGRCLPIALPHACYVAASRRDDDLVTLHGLQAPESWEGRIADVSPTAVTGFPAYVAGVLWALHGDHVRVPGLDLVVDGRVPLGAGLSSSAALEVAVALAACEAAGLELDDTVRDRIVTECMRAENDIVGAPTGGMDQAIAAFARPGQALLVDFGTGGRRHVPWDPEAADLTLLVLDTRVQHALSDGSYGDRREESAAAARALDVPTLIDVDEALLDRIDDETLRRRARHVLTEDRRVGEVVDALDSGDLASVGPLLTASHASLRDDYEVSCDELDLAVETALAAGAVGARMTGGGFGGSAIALVPTDRVALVEQAVARAFVDRGWELPAVLEAPASGAASRLA